MNTPLRMLATVSLASRGKTLLRLSMNWGGLNSTINSLNLSLHNNVHIELFV